MGQALKETERALFDLEQRCRALPERMAAAVKARGDALHGLARLEVRGESASEEAEALRESLADAEEKILVNGRLNRAFEEELAAARHRRDMLRGQRDATLRAKWEPRLRARQAALEQEMVAAAREACAVIGLLGGIPASLVSPEKILKRAAWTPDGAPSFAAQVAKRMEELRNE